MQRAGNAGRSRHYGELLGGWEDLIPRMLGVGTREGQRRQKRCMTGKGHRPPSDLSDRTRTCNGEAERKQKQLQGAISTTETLLYLDRTLVHPVYVSPGSHPNTKAKLGGLICFKYGERSHVHRNCKQEDTPKDSTWTQAKVQTPQTHGKKGGGGWTARDCVNLLRVHPNSSKKGMGPEKVRDTQGGDKMCTPGHPDIPLRQSKNCIGGG